MSQKTTSSDSVSQSTYSLYKLFLYFFLLGTIGFGGTFTMADMTHKELVEKKKWITNDQFKQALAFTQFAPGPLMTQLAMYIGFLKSGFLGAALSGIGIFITPFIFILILTMLYKEYGNIAWIEHTFAAISPATVGIIVSATISLITKTVRQKSLWAILCVIFIASLITGKINYYLLLAGGIGSLVLNMRSIPKAKSFALFPFIPSAVLISSPLWQLFIFFISAGLLAFGGGIAILPYLQSGVVNQYHWMTNRDFLNGIAIAMATPGPVILLCVFVGYFVGKFWGALIATIGIFLPAYSIVILCAPILKKFSHNKYFKSFIDGIIAAAMGAIMWSVLILGKISITSLPTLALAIGAFLSVRFLKLQPALVILLAGILGILFFKTN